MSDVYDFWETGICFEDAVPLPNSPVGLTGMGDIKTHMTCPLLISRISLNGVLRGMNLTVTDVTGTIHNIAEKVNSETGYDSGDFEPIMAVEIGIHLSQPSFVKELVVLKTIEFKYLRGTFSDTCACQLVSQEITIWTNLSGESRSIIADWALAHLIKGFSLKPEDPFKDYDPFVWTED